MYDWRKEHCEQCVADRSICKNCRDNPIYADYPTQSYFMPYNPVCPRGYADCVNDPAYILYTDPKYYKKVFGNMTPTQAIFVENGCMDSVKRDPDEKYYCYDDEDK